MGFSRLFNSSLSDPITSNQQFVYNISGSASPYSGSANLNLSGEATAIVTYVRYRAGEPILPMHTTNQQIFICFEQANIKYSSIINTYQTRNWMTNMLGLQKNFTLNDLTNKLPFNQYTYLQRITQQVAGMMNPPVGGNQEVRKGYFVMQGGVQDYSVLNSIVDVNSGLTIAQQIQTLSGSLPSNNITLKNIYHYPATTLYRFYDPYSSINLLSQEFNFESFNTETIFYVLPLWTDILRAQQLNMNDKVRRSNYSYETIGDRLRIYPPPLSTMGGIKVFVDYQFASNPFGPNGSLSADPSITGISNISNVPFTDISYDQINSIGKNFIREYCFELAKETEGYIRRKFKEIPVPNGSITLDGDTLVQEAIAHQEKLEKELRADLEELTTVKLMEQEAKQLQYAQDALSKVPLLIYMG